MPAKPLSPEQLADAARLRDIFQHAKERDPTLTQAQLAYECGWNTQGTVSQYLLGKIPLNLDALLKFCCALRVAPDRISPSLAERLRCLSQLLQNTELNEGEAVYGPPDTAPPVRRKGRRARDPGVIDVPLLDARDCLKPDPLDRLDATEMLSIRRERLQRHLVSETTARLAILPAHDDTMRDTIGDGDLLLVDLGVASAEHDAVYVLALRDSLHVKRLQRRPDDSVLLISDNKRYEPYLVKADEREALRVVGRVLLVWNSHKL